MKSNTFAANLVADQAKQARKENVTTTTNGAKAFKSTLNANVDLHAKLGSARQLSEAAIISTFDAALKEDSDIALRNMLMLRDVRGGMGERNAFRICLKHLYDTNYNVLINSNLLSKVPEVGRWDDLLVFFDKAYNKEIKQKITAIIKQGIEDKNGLLCKWLPRNGPVAAELRYFLGWTPKFYRKTIVGLTNVVETTMCKGKPSFKEINFNHVPSRAMQIYKKAFSLNAVDEFKAWREALVNGTGDAKINAGAVFPHQVLNEVVKGTNEMSPVFEKQWDALPNYIADGVNILPMIDVSGSMDTPAVEGYSCMDIAIALGMYTATKMSGDFNDCYLTFSERPIIAKLHGKSLKEKVNNVRREHVGYNTNVNAAFLKIVEFAKTHKISHADMPKFLVLFSDMQFDVADRTDGNKTGFAMAKAAFKDAGYDLPKIVFWNLNANVKNVPVKFDKNGTALVSGFSPALMKSIFSAELDADDFTPLALMLKALQVERYNINYGV